MGRHFEPIPDDAEAKPLAEYLRELTLRADVTLIEVAKAVNYEKGTISTVLNGKRLSGFDKYGRHVMGLRIAAAAKGTADQIPDAAEQEVRALFMECKARLAAKVSPLESALQTVNRYITRLPGDEDRMTASSASPGASSRARPTTNEREEPGAGEPQSGATDWSFSRTPASLTTARTKTDILAALNELKKEHGFDLSTRNRGDVGADMTAALLADILDGRARLSRNRLLQVAVACGDDSYPWAAAWDRVEGGASGERVRVIGTAKVLQPPNPATSRTVVATSRMVVPWFRRRRSGTDAA
jgi:hypothetical protein